MRVSLPGVDHVALDLSEKGAGRPIVVLHGIEKLGAEPPLHALLARGGRAVAPAHPGFGASPLPDWIDSIDDLSYLYLDLLDQLDLQRRRPCGIVDGRVDCGRDGGEMLPPPVASGADLPLRHQGR